MDPSEQGVTLILGHLHLGDSLFEAQPLSKSLPNLRLDLGEVVHPQSIAAASVTELRLHAAGRLGL